MPEAGDIFVMLPPDDLFLYGRVIKTDTRVIPGFRANLLYVYRDRSATRTPIPSLGRREPTAHTEDYLPRHRFEPYSRVAVIVRVGVGCGALPGAPCGCGE